ncbi:MAG TPA: bifunctional oligoribonuclease/PAP phosphatase NrnA [Mycobacteriales bacterium]|nr:bifunctional oligoribonuclease/PAP phosphatase NrnA [Mycobacteriales bacterium]
MTGSRQNAAVASPARVEWDAALAALRRHDEIALVCHVNPDGDALGSMLALAQALARTGRRVVPSFPSPYVVPDSLRFLPGQDLLVAPAEMPAAPGLLMTFDTGSVDRLGDLGDRVGTAGEVLVVDHHASNTRFGTVHVVDPTAVATAVLAERLIDRLGVGLDADLATCLYAGLASDTGSFRYAGTTAETHALAGRLLATGIRPDLISRELFDTHPFGWQAMLGEALGRVRLEPAAVGGLGLVWTWLGDADLAGRGLASDQAESVIDIVRTAREAEVAMVLKELDGARHVSVRSRGRVDVGAACVALGGGGHRFAAGFTSYDDRATVVARLRLALDDAPRIDP